MPKRVIIGVVTSDKMSKTRTVKISRTVLHPIYKKFIRSTAKCYVHDENEESHEGDTVEIIEANPASKLKRWSLVRVVEKSTAVDVAALRAAGRKTVEEQMESEIAPAADEN